MSKKKIRVAAIQPICQPGPVADNLNHLETLINEAASRGAELALLPERFPEAFHFDESAWLAASPANGKVATWIVEMSHKYGLYLGGSFLEARGEDFYNYGKRRIAAYHDSFRRGATLLAQRHGIPVVMANKAGPWETPLPGWLPAVDSAFPGFSHIADTDGRELARLDAQEGVIVAEVTLDPVHKQMALDVDTDRHRPWVVPVPSDFKTFALFEFFGRRNYERNPLRKELAHRAVLEDAR